MAISRAQLLKELLPGLNALFGLEYKNYGEEHKEIYETETSERSFEEETKLSGFSAAPVKSEGAELLDTELRVATADNDINALKAMGSIPGGYTVNHYLTDTNAWFLTTDVPNGMKHFVRTPLQNSMDGDFDTGNVRYKSRERYSFGWSDPLGMFGSPGSS
jgi:hypothetical protein